jgi:hypothetical protein
LCSNNAIVLASVPSTKHSWLPHPAQPAAATQGRESRHFCDCQQCPSNIQVECPAAQQLKLLQQTEAARDLNRSLLLLLLLLLPWILLLLLPLQL